MPRKRKRSTSPPKVGLVGSNPGRSGLSGMGDGDSVNSIQQGVGSISRSNPHLHSHDPEAIISPRSRHHQPPIHSPHYQPPYEQPHHTRPYSPPPQDPNSYTHPQTFYRTASGSQHYQSPPDEARHPHPITYPPRDRSPPNATPNNPPPNPHAPSHYNFANRAYAQQRDSGFNTFRVNPGPIPGLAAGGPSSAPPPVNVSPPLNALPILVPPSGQHQRQDEGSLPFHHRSHSHSQHAASTSTSISTPYGRLSPPVLPPKDIETEHEMRGASANGAGRWRPSHERNRNGNGNESPRTSSDEEDVPYNPATAGGRSRAMVKYLIMKAKYRYVLDEHALLKDELESLKKEEHDQWRLKEVGVDEIIRSFGSDSDRFIHDRDQQATLYQLHHDSTDGDQDLFTELDRERRAFRNRERGRNSGWEREGYVADANNDERRRDYHSHNRHINTGKDGDVDLASPTPMNMQLSQPGSNRDNRQGEPKQPRSSSRTRSEPRLDTHTQSYNYPPHPYRRTPPPPSSTLDREYNQGPFPHTSVHSQQSQPSSSSFRMDGAERQHAPRRTDAEYSRNREQGEPEAGYVPPPRHQRQRSSGGTHGSGRVESPPSQRQRQNHYQSPPSPPPPQQQPLNQSPPILPPHSYRESIERSERHRVHKDDAEQSGQEQKREYNYGPASTSTHHRLDDEPRQTREEEMQPMAIGMEHARSPPSRSPLPVFDPTQAKRSPRHVLTSTHTHLVQNPMPESSQEQELDSNARHKRGHSSLEESVKEKEYERVMGTTTPISDNRDPAAVVQSEPRRRYSPSPRQFTGPSHAQSQVDPSPSSELSAPLAQMRIEPGATTASSGEEDQDQSRTSSAVPPPPSSHPQSPRLSNSASDLKPATSPALQPTQTASSSENDVAQGPRLQTPPPSSAARPHSTHTVHPTSTSPHHLRSTSISHSVDSSTVPEHRPIVLRSPPIPQTRHSRYAYAYYPNESAEVAADDVDTPHNPASTTKGSREKVNSELNRSFGSGENSGRSNDETGEETGLKASKKGTMDVD